MADSNTDSTPILKNETLYLRSNWGEVLRVVVLGAAVGLSLPWLSAVLDQYFIIPVFCHTNTTLTICSSSANVSYLIMTALLTIGATVALAHWQIFRPLLIAAATTVALWGLNKQLAGVQTHSVVEFYLLSALSYTSVYLLFFWLLRMGNFVASVLLSALVLVAMRWLLVM